MARVTRYVQTYTGGFEVALGKTEAVPVKWTETAQPTEKAPEPEETAPKRTRKQPADEPGKE